MDLVSRFEVHLVQLEPTIGGEIQKTRPCVVISPNAMNRRNWVVIVAPLTSTQKPYPTRIPCLFQGRQGDVALEHLRSVDVSRLVKRLGVLSDAEAEKISGTLHEMFAL